MHPSSNWRCIQAWCLVSQGYLALGHPASIPADTNEGPLDKDLNTHTLPSSIINPDSPTDLHSPPDYHTGLQQPSELQETSVTNYSTSMLVVPPPHVMQWIGTIGGAVGIFSFLEGWAERIGKWIAHKKEEPKKENPVWKNPSWTVSVQVGLDATGLDGHQLEGAEGDFPQFCLWDGAGKLLSFNEQSIRIDRDAMEVVPNHENTHGLFKVPRPEGMPFIESGGFQTVNMWPMNDKMQESTKQAAYVTMVKRHYDAVCVASVHVSWPDESLWTFDGSWGKASNMSWYHSHLYDFNDKQQQECFWLDHRGNLDSSQDRKEEYVLSHFFSDRRWGSPYIGGMRTLISWEWLDHWLFASDTRDEKGIPSGKDLTEGMKKNGVDKGNTPLGVKFFLPGVNAEQYVARGRNLSEYGYDDFTANPGKIKWFTESMSLGPKYQNPVFPIVDPGSDFSDKKVRIIEESAWDRHFRVPIACLTDWYYDGEKTFINPADGNRCVFTHSKDSPDELCHHTKRDLKKPKTPPAPLRHRFKRALVMDQLHRGGTGAKRLCDHPHSVGPSYASLDERQYCRMTDKTLWPFCEPDQGLTSNCFDEESEVLVEHNVPLAKRDTHWDLIENWSHTGRVKRALGEDGKFFIKA